LLLSALKCSIGSVWSWNEVHPWTLDPMLLDFNGWYRYDEWTPAGHAFHTYSNFIIYHVNP
jgi:hypothetical protein